MDLLLPYVDKDSQKVNWEKLDLEHPGWDNKFPNRKWAYTAARRFKTNGRFLFELNRIGGVPTAPEGQKPLSEAEQVVLRAFKEYPAVGGRAGRSVDWAKATAAHPEWKEHMCYTSDIEKGGHLKGRHVLLKLVGRGLVNPYGPTPAPASAANGTAAHTPATVEMTEEQKEQFLEKRIHQEATKIAAERMAAFFKQMTGCPRCLCDLREHFRVAMSAARIE